jgi:hypothetical protein
MADMICHKVYVFLMSILNLKGINNMQKLSKVNVFDILVSMGHEDNLAVIM